MYIFFKILFKDTPTHQLQWDPSHFFKNYNCQSEQVTTEIGEDLPSFAEQLQSMFRDKNV